MSQNSASAADGPVLLDLPFDQYTRHRIVQRLAESVRRIHERPKLRVLDVGGYPCLTPRFLSEDRVIVIDVARPGSNGSWPSNGGSSGPSYICADGAALPFASGSFDLVVSLDSLEHVPGEHRTAYVAELLRVTRSYVLILAPFDQEETELAEHLVEQFVRVVNQEEQPQLREHRELGLPKLSDWVGFVTERGLELITFSSGFVYNWLPMMLLKHYVLSLPNSEALHHSIDRFYNVSLQQSDARAPGYRQGILVSAVGPSKVLDEMAAALAPTGQADRLEVIERTEQIGLLLKLADLHIASRRDDHLRDQLVDKERHILNLETAIRLAEERQRSLEDEVRAARQEADRLQEHLADIRGGRAMRAIDALSQLWSAVGGESGSRRRPSPPPASPVNSPSDSSANETRRG